MFVECLYESVADEFPIGIWRSDLEGNIQFANKKLKKYFSDEELLGNFFTVIIPSEEDKNIFLSMWDKEGDTIFEFKDGENDRWYRLQVHRVQDSYIGITSNITSEKTLIPQLLSFKRDKFVF